MLFGFKVGFSPFVPSLRAVSFSPPCTMSSRWHPAKKTKVDESTPKPNWLELPRDITSNILQRLDAFTVFTRPRKVCAMWRNIYNDPFMWRTIDMSMKYMYIYDSPRRRYGRSESLRKMCRYAVDLSCGHLEDIRIFRFGTDELLKYVVDRANHLRSIEVDNCWGVSDEGMRKISKKLSFVEKLDIRACIYVDRGRLFPECDEKAFAIAKTMPRLRYLNITANSITHVGFTAILGEFPLLESLYIRRYPNLNFSGNLWKKCQDQIKDLLFI